MITIPFDLERAKRIQAGEEPGKIVTRTGSNARIICWDKVDDEFPIVALIKDDNIELISTYRTNGTFRYGDKELSDLMLQIPQYAQFKDGDVLSNIDGDFVPERVRDKFDKIINETILEIKNEIEAL